MIRSTILEYGFPLFDGYGKPVKIKVGLKLINLAMEENQENTDYVELLEKNIINTYRIRMMKMVEIG